jgi:hypothetical protein
MVLVLAKKMRPVYAAPLMKKTKLIGYSYAVSIPAAVERQPGPATA